MDPKILPEAAEAAQARKAALRAFGTAFPLPITSTVQAVAAPHRSIPLASMQLIIRF